MNPELDPFPARARWLGLPLLCGLLAGEVFGAAQTFRGDSNFLIETWETEDGLPDNSVTAMVQTPDGYLWLGTFEGLVRFDGVKFAVFDRSNVPELPSDGIVNLHLDRKGRLWVSTYGGLAVRDGNQWRQLTRIEGGAADYARTFTERANGDLLITTFGGKLFEIAGTQITELPPPPGEPGQGYLGGADEDGHWWAVQNKFVGRWEQGSWVRMISPPELARDAVGCAPSRDGGLWLLLGRELLKLRRGLEVTRVTMTEGPGGVWSLSEDSRGNVWIATFNQGVCRVTTNGTMMRWTAANGGSDSTRCFFEDRERNVWIGSSGGGLMRFTPRRFQHFELEGGRKEFLVRSVSADSGSGIWAATYGQGLFRLGTSSFTNAMLPGAAGGASILQSVLMDRVGRLWIGTYGDALWLVENEVARHVPREQSGGHNVLALFEDSRGQVWVSGGGSVARFDGTNFHAFGREQGVPGAAASFAEGASGVIWLSTGSGVFRQESERKFTEVRVGERSIAGIGCLKSDPNGSMWLGSSDRGLLRWKDGRLAAVDAGAGFPVNTVHSVVEDGSGFFWMTSSRSIVRAHGSDLHAVADGTKARLVCQEFDASDGLPRAEFTSGRQPVSARDGQGRLWFATTKGVVMTDPARLQLNDVPPPVHIEALVYHKPLKNGKGRESSARFNTENGSPNGAPRGLGASEVRLTTPFANPLRLPAGSGRIEIHYTATSLTAPERVRFQVKLEGHDPGWQDAPDRRVTYYHEPPPGRHSFHVRAANNDGLWNESGTSLAFSVLPFFWQTWWFRLVVIAALINLGGAAAWWRSRKKHNRELEELERSRRHQAELAHFGRVSTMGQLASSLAHELNQPLGAILRNAEAAELFLQSNPPDLEEVRAILADIRHDDRRAGDVIDRMRALLKRREFQASRLDVNDLVSEVAALVRPDAEARRMSLIIQPASTPAMVWADRVQLQQVLLNLLINAMDAMHDCPPEKRSALVQVRPVLDGVELAISDTGHGISEVNLKHLFDSFFTTKSNGLGMGLAISQTIVAAHGGRITAQNNEYGGATFRFTLSATAKPGSKL